jgi:acetate kinase
MKVLVLNSGSSSVKFQLFEFESGEGKVIAKGLADRIGQPEATVVCSCKRTQGEACKAKTSKVDIPDHRAAINAICTFLLGPECGAIKDLTELAGIGHRVVHGAEHFSGSMIINDEVIAGIEECCKLAPLHNPPALLGIYACADIFKGIPQVAVFDTAFHHTIPKKAYLYALPMELYKEHGVRKYGFHGTSHFYVAHEAARALGKPIEELKIVTCHLGNGCSITAVEGGKSVDTSMGLTPLAGVIMGTRCGNIDPYIPFFMIKELGMSVDEADKMLNKASGLKGICGLNDVRDVIAHAVDGDAYCALAIDMFAYRIAMFVGGYAMVMGGVDAVVFTGGIGEHSPLMRARILARSDYLGLKLDAEKNERNDRCISTDDSTVSALVIPTNEELVIAQETVQLVSA